MSIYVNSTKIKQISLPDMGTWDYWGDRMDTVTLNSGANTVKYQYDSTDTAHVNLDFVQVSTAGLHYETESLTVAASSGSTRNFADTACINGNGAIIDATAVGNFVTYSVVVPEARTYDIKLRTKNLNTRGIAQLAIASTTGGTYTNHGNPIDEYVNSTTPTYTLVDIGQVAFGTSGTKAFRFTITGKDAGSTSYGFASDYILLIPN
jgi:hypothetical protein